MGVKGLCTFMDKNSQHYQTYKLHDTKVIIDGCNLAHFLYNHYGIDFVFGGEYREYAESIKNYFFSYTKCNIEPIVIFDGVSDKEDLKFELRLQRCEKRLESINDLIETRKSQNNFLPINAFDVFKSVLAEIGIQFMQCDYNGDNQVAVLANDYKCPVLSDDSDFYIFHLTDGFIRLSHIDTQVKTYQQNRYKPGIKYLKCFIYFQEQFVQYYSLKDTNMLPLFATLAGNDFVDYNDFKRFFFKIKVYPKEKFVGLLSWLANYNLNQAINQVLRLTDEDVRHDIKELIHVSMEDYCLKPTNLRHALDVGTLHPSDMLIRNTKVVTPCGETLPVPFLVALHCGQISISMLNIIMLHERFLQPQVEKFSQLSSYSFSQYIRQVTYGIILQHKTRNIHRHNRKCLRKVNEYDRVNDEILEVKVPFLTILKDGTPIPKFTEIFNMQKANLKAFVIRVLEVPESFLIGLQSNIQLFLASVVYWMCNCFPKPTIEFLDALLLCIIYHQLKQAESLEHQPNENTVRNKSLKAKSPPVTDICRNMEVYLEKPDINHLNIIVMQYYSQLQTCINDIVHLNSVIGFPFHQPQLHEILSGVMLYNLTEELIQYKPNLNSFIEGLLGNRANPISQFNMLKMKILDNIPKSYFHIKQNKRFGRNKSYYK